MPRFQTILLFALLLPFFSFQKTRPPLRPGKDLAVLFAVEKYQNPQLSNLQNPIKNAREIAAELKNRFGFETEVLENPTQAQIVAKLNELTRLYANNADGRHASDGQLFLFFSGHGMSEDENGYFLPADADPAQPWAKGIAYEIWRPKIDKINCRHILVALDACYSVRFDPDWKNKTDGQFKRPGELTDTQRALANYEQYTARVFFTSDNKEDQTPDRSNFARKLLEGLRTAPARGGFLTSSQLFANYVQDATPSPRAGTFGSDQPSSAFLLYDLTPVPTAPADPDQATWNSVQRQNTPEAYRTDNMVLITGGTFQMGDQFGDVSSGETAHSVTVSTFYMGKTEVTFDEYDAYCTATGRAKPSDSGWGRGKRPVINVDWYDAVKYCNWLSQQQKLTPAYTITKWEEVSVDWNAKGYRLPTEAEWEYAARALGGKGGGKVRFGNGRDILDPSQANFEAIEFYKEPYSVSGEWRNQTLPVASFSANSLGLYDMAGNVFEWCQDWYGSDYYGLSDGACNPSGAGSGMYRCVRSGSYFYGPFFCRTSNRFSWRPNYSNDNIGFRVVRH